MRSDYSKNDTVVYLNGTWLPQEEAALPIQDRGVRFGDGVFETIRVMGGHLCVFPYHLVRMKAGLAALKIIYDLAKLENLCQEAVVRHQLSDGFIRIMVTRGEGSQGYLPNEGATPTLVIETVVGIVAVPEAVKLWVSQYEKISPKALPVESKMMQGLQSSLARVEAKEQGCFEALLLNAAGEVAEGSSANIFWVKEGVIYTPSTNVGLLPGVTRRVIIENLGVEVIEGAYSLEELLNADEVFLTNVAWLVLPVKEVLPHAVSFQTNQTAAIFRKQLRDYLTNN